MLSLIKPSPIIVIMITVVGIMMHDMHLDKAATAAVGIASAVATTGALEKTITPNYHVHVERASLPKLASSLPNMQPPREDTRRYVQSKKLFFSGGGDTATIWPSV